MPSGLVANCITYTNPVGFAAAEARGDAAVPGLEPSRESVTNEPL